MSSRPTSGTQRTASQKKKKSILTRTYGSALASHSLKTVVTALHVGTYRQKVRSPPTFDRTEIHAAAPHYYI